MKLKNFLLEIPVADWPALKDMYVDNWPENYSTYFAIDNGMNLKQRDPVNYKNEIQLFSLNGDWSDGTFILLVSFAHKYLSDSMVCLLSFWIILGKFMEFMKFLNSNAKKVEINVGKCMKRNCQNVVVKSGWQIIDFFVIPFR